MPSLLIELGAWQGHFVWDNSVNFSDLVLGLQIGLDYAGLYLRSSQFHMGSTDPVIFVLDVFNTSAKPLLSLHTVFWIFTNGHL